MEMQQVGVDPNDLRAQPRGPLYLDELTSSVRSVTSEKCQKATLHAWFDMKEAAN